MIHNKNYKGSLNLDWFLEANGRIESAKAYSVITTNAPKKGDIPAPVINWVNKEESLFYEIDENSGYGVKPFFVNRNDIRVKEVRSLVHQNTFTSEPIFETEESNNTSEALVTENKKKIVGYNVLESGVIEDKIPTIPTEPSQGLLIKGDNLLALNTLKKMFEGKPDEEKVKCIYIDPPYNTGSAFENYDDNLAHSEWLSMIRDRLVILRDLLRNDGVIFVQCDDNEQAYLKVLMDEVFGRENFGSNIVTRATPNARDYGLIAQMHEHILIYAKDIYTASTNHLEVRDKEFSFADEFGGFNIHPLYNSNVAFNIDNRKNLYYPFYVNNCKQDKDGFFEISLEKQNENTIEVFPPKSIKEGVQFVWRWGKDKSIENLNKEIVGHKTRGGSFRIVQKMRNDSQIARSIWYETEFSNRRATDDLQKLFKNKVFTFPKSEYLLERIIAISTQSNDLILDCFGGSGTTFAVATKMKRRWIGVEMGNHADTIDIPRLQKVISGTDQGGISINQDWKGGGSFDYYHLGESIYDYKNETFNWSIGNDIIADVLLKSFDFKTESDFVLKSVLSSVTFEGEQTEKYYTGVNETEKEIQLGVCSINEDEEVLINFGTIQYMMNDAKEYAQSVGKTLLNVSLFTNRQIELRDDSVPDNFSLIKVPYIIFNDK
jgi:adenine-specific DNA-methyltransferase